MKGKLTIILAVVEALALVTMKLMDWKETKAQKPAASKARKAGGRRVVNPCPPDYNDGSPVGDSSGLNLLEGRPAPDKTIHEED